MIDAHVKQLIHAALDDELDQADAAELEQHLAASLEARGYQDGMKELDAFIARAPAREPPDDLHVSIMNSVSLPRARRRPLAFGFGRLPGFVRYGFAAAAGLLLATGIYEYRPQLGDGPDMSGMVGTILPEQKADRGAVMDRVTFELETVSSEVVLYRQDSALVLDVTLEAASGPVEMRVDFAGDGLDFDAIAQMRSELESIEVADSAVRIVAGGNQHFAILLNRDPASGSAARINLSWTSDGKLLKSAELIAER